MSNNRTVAKFAGVVTTGLMVSIGALAQNSADSPSSPSAAPQPPQAAVDELQEVTDRHDIADSMRGDARGASGRKLVFTALAGFLWVARRVHAGDAVPAADDMLSAGFRERNRPGADLVTNSSWRARGARSES